MRSRFFRKGIPLFTILVLAISASAFASGKIMYNAHGIVTAVNLGNKMLTVYETNFFWTKNTIFSDEKESVITVDKLKPQTWIYIVCEYDTGTKKRIAKKVYLLPKPIKEKDKHLYPFME